MDSLFRQETGSGSIEMIIKNPKWSKPRTVSLKIWSKEQDFTLIKILAPKKNQGISTLKRKKKMWNYFPKINRQLKVHSSMMNGSWMGSDFTNDDLVRDASYTKDYKHTLVIKDDFYLLTLTPRKNAISLWGKIEMTIRKKSLLPKKYTFYNEKNKKIRTLSFDKVKKFSGKTLPSLLKMTSHIIQGKETTIAYKNMTFNKKIDDSFFSFKNLKKENL